MKTCAIILEQKEDAMKAEHRKAIMVEFNKAEKEAKPALDNMFADVFDQLERPLREQKAELKRLIQKWGQTDSWKKDLEKFEGGRAAIDKW